VRLACWRRRSNGRTAERIAHCGELSGEVRRCAVAESRMRAAVVAIVAPITDGLAGVIEASE